MRRILILALISILASYAQAQDNKSETTFKCPASTAESSSLKEIQDFIAAFGSILSGLAAAGAIYVAHRVHENQKLLSQRQLLLPLWDHMATLSMIDPTAPNAQHAVKTVNTLELVALCCEGGMIDEKVILRTFRDAFMFHYEQLLRCNIIPGLGKDGPALVRENAAAMAFYKKLEMQRMSRDQINRI
ncbi:hypothetical protein [Rugamonas sp. DEMB1]|uniref:DUF4760 domain-containing protein n=1 Tax=Rugamonas sp. DEMB1 TaxID=3039386 RepID=UPI00244A2EF5|nr:hypothetical protein [Rugamonas sp. DEMB1]WGG52110.1 hypothetical protein QC826_08015 [Rugamonas sp. DEMB1]